MGLVDTLLDNLAGRLLVTPPRSWRAIARHLNLPNSGEPCARSRGAVSARLPRGDRRPATPRGNSRSAPTSAAPGTCGKTGGMIHELSLERPHLLDLRRDQCFEVRCDQGAGWVGKRTLEATPARGSGQRRSGSHLDFRQFLTRRTPRAVRLIKTLALSEKGVHDVEDATAIPSAAPGAARRAGSHGAPAGGARRAVRGARPDDSQIAHAGRSRVPINGQFAVDRNPDDPRLEGYG